MISRLYQTMIRNIVLNRDELTVFHPKKSFVLVEDELGHVLYCVQKDELDSRAIEIVNSLNSYLCSKLGRKVQTVDRS